MISLWLIKIGEITLKKGNRPYFERTLKTNIERRFNEIHADVHVKIRSGRYYLETRLNEEAVSDILRTTPGIVAFSQAKRTKKELPELHQAALAVAKESVSHGRSFKFEVRRTDKKQALDSYGYARELGNMLLEAMPELTVNVHNPSFVINVEIRELAYVYPTSEPGTGGLPVSTSGQGMLLLSGGIDSPVAGCLMSKRGLRLTAVHFHTSPFTSKEAHEKVQQLAALMAPRCGGLTLLSVPFTACQVLINQCVEISTTTLHSRACMMQVAEKLAKKCHCGALITGEALGQVASQTLEGLAYTDASVDLPVLRPLVGMDKTEIIQLSRDIGTYETAVQPFDDCCTLFSPQRPKTRPNVQEEQAHYASIPNLDILINEAVKNTETIRFDSHGRQLRD